MLFPQDGLGRSLEYQITQLRAGGGKRWCAEFNKDATAPDPQKEHTRGFYFGGQTKFDPWSAARGRLTAFDASTGREKWRYDAAKPLIAGVTATEGGLIFTGELTGDLLAASIMIGDRRKLVSEHRITALGLRARGFVLNDVPMLGENSVLHADNIHDDPIGYPFAKS